MNLFDPELEQAAISKHLGKLKREGLLQYQEPRDVRITAEYITQLGAGALVFTATVDGRVEMYRTCQVTDPVGLVSIDDQIRMITGRVSRYNTLLRLFQTCDTYDGEAQSDAGALSSSQGSVLDDM